MKIQLEEELKSTVYATIKIGCKTNLESFQLGKIYCRSLDYYKNIENEGQPFHDSNEGLTAIYQSNQVELILKNSEGQEIKLNEESGLIGHVKISKNFPYPALCIHALHTHGWNNELNSETLDDLRKFLLPAEELKKFGTHCLIFLDGDEFNSRLFKKANEMGIEVHHGMVRYIDINSMNGSIDENFLGFVKSNNFEREREYRYLFKANNLPDPFVIDIGNLDDITTITTLEELCDSLVITLPD